MKCRIKKKAEFEELKIKLQDLKNLNVELGLQFKNTQMLYADKEKENEQLRSRLDTLQSQQTMMLAYLLNQSQMKLGLQ